jgi:coatomer subunit beta'
LNAAQTNTFAVRLENGTIEVYKNFEKIKAFKTEASCDGIFGGRLLALRSKECVTFYDWDTFDVVRRIELSSNLKHVFWSEDSSKVTLTLESSFYLLEFDSASVE